MMFFLLLSLIFSQDYQLSNEHLTYIWETNNNILTTKKILNHDSKIPHEIIPAPGTEEFIISARSCDKNHVQSNQDSASINYEIKSSDLIIQDIQNKESKIVITYKSYASHDMTWDIKEIAELETNKHYLHKYFQIKCSNQDVVIDHIDLNSLTIKDNDLSLSWSTPMRENSPRNLGQPIYINSFFLGCRFPLTESVIDSNQKVARIRYYSGKKLSELPHNDDGYYETWQTVLGVSHGNQFDIVQKDFFSYISDISVPTPLRKQYNDISSSKSVQLFQDIERGFSQFGLSPLDSFVINDKNSKNKLSTTKLAKKINTNVGILLNQKASKITNKYIEKVKNNLVNYIHKYKVNYINAKEFDEIPDSTDIYRLTEKWEQIISAYKEMIKAAHEEKIANFWISSPKHTNLSPFHLQWSNSILSEATIKPKEIQGNIDQLLTKIDQKIWSLIENDQIQFPTKNLQTNIQSKLNGPIDNDDFRAFLYGNAMRGESFVDLNQFTQKVSNEADKWFINSDVLSWIDKNYDTLQHSQRFGGQPMNGEIYGYSCWHGNEGIVSIRNPSSETKKISIKLDSKIGLNDQMKTVYRTTRYSHKSTDLIGLQNGVAYNYGDELEVTLNAGEFRIYEFHDFVDSKSPTVEVVKTTSNNEVLIRFNKHIDLSKAVFKIDGIQVKEKRVRGDLRTVLLTTSSMKNYSVYSLRIEKVKDLNGNELNTRVGFQHFANNEIISINSEITGNDNAILLTDVATDCFTINLHVKNFKGTQKGTLLHSDDNSIVVELDENRRVKFTVDSVSVISKEKVRDNRDYQFSFVRERNTMLKIYVNMKLSNSTYHKERPNMVNLKRVKLSRNPAVYSSISINNYALPYNEIPYEISLKNEFIEQVFSIQNGKVSTKQILNHRADEVDSFTPAAGSEEWSFSIPDKTDPSKEVVVKSSDCEFEWEYRKNSANVETIVFYYYYTYKRVQINISKRYELLPHNYFIEKQVEIKCSDGRQIFNYIDLDTFQLSENDEQKSWTHPIREQDYYSRLSPFIITLGQPIYINSFFTGCLFPLTDNAIENHVSRLRYHSGKSFINLLDDNPIEADQDVYTYYCWKTIFGAARSDRREIVRKDLFDYISSISVPTTFRKQYNSWYDWMLNIDESNILSSFKEIEHGFNQYGVPPLDSYVVDDGWNNYNSLKYDVYDEKISGTTYNNAGFWSFNSKFPEGLTKPSDFTHRISSRFGVWLGPRGGYVTPGQFGKIIEDAKNGFYNEQSNDVDVGSAKYIDKLDSFLSDWIHQYKVNYLKLDGFASKACANSQHDHMVGGPEGVYYFTDLWERYIRVFEHLRAVAVENDVDDFWISITSYVNPSPFHLQWSNSVWIQVSDDIGYVNASINDNLANQILNYRDSCYYDFYESFQFQFPSKCLYNHDPIYGKSGTSLNNSLNNDYFRTYLYFCAMRGNAFTEMYYTSSMLDEGDKWYINSEVLKWTESHFDVIQNSQRFGGNPRFSEVYGYSAWNDKSGIIAIRNPSGRSTEYTLKLDHSIGVPENIGTTFSKSILTHNTQQALEEGKSYHYNDEIKFVLKPREARIIEFTQNEDKEKPKIEVVKALSKQRVLIRFDKKIIKNEKNYKIDNLQILNVSIKADRRTIILRTSPMEKNKEYELELEDVKDQFGNKIEEEEIKFTYFPHGLISSLIENSKKLFEGETLLSDGEFSTDSFSIVLDIEHVNTGNQNAILLQDADNKISSEIVEGKLKFTIGDLSVTSKENLPESNCKVTLVRERNKMIKIYINDEISNSAYDPKIKDDSVSIKKLSLKQAPVTYRSVVAANYALKYNEEPDTSENDDDLSQVDFDDDIRDYIDDQEDSYTPSFPITSSSSSSSFSSASSSPSISITESTGSSGGDGDNDGNESKSVVDRVKVYIIVFVILFVIAVALAVVLVFVIINRKKVTFESKSQVVSPLMTESY